MVNSGELLNEVCGPSTYSYLPNVCTNFQIIAHKEKDINLSDIIYQRITHLKVIFKACFSIWRDYSKIRLIIIFYP